MPWLTWVTCSRGMSLGNVRLLYRKMGDAGVSLVYPENLSITDKEASKYVELLRNSMDGFLGVAQIRESGASQDLGQEGTLRLYQDLSPRTHIGK